MVLHNPQNEATFPEAQVLNNLENEFLPVDPIMKFRLRGRSFHACRCKSGITSLPRFSWSHVLSEYLLFLLLAVGLVMAAVFVIMDKFSVTFATKGNFSPMLAAWMPNIIFSFVAGWLYWKA